LAALEKRLTAANALTKIPGINLEFAEVKMQLPFLALLTFLIPALDKGSSTVPRNLGSLNEHHCGMESRAVPPKPASEPF
jgi:hypothetical protein